MARGVARTALRKVWSTIFYILSRGFCWIDLPESKRYAHRATARRWLLRWQQEGVFDRVLSGWLQQALKEHHLDLSQVIVDGTFPLSPGGDEQAGYGYKGKGGLIHLLVDHNGHPLAASTTSAGGDKRSQVIAIVKTCGVDAWTRKRGKISLLEADKGYDSSVLRQKLLNCSILPVIPWRENRKDRVPMSQLCSTFQVHTKRWILECSIAWIKRKFRRLLMQWERRWVAWCAMVLLALIFYWVNLLR